MNLGEYVNNRILNDKMLRIFLSTFAELPYNVIWRWADKMVFKIPANVKIWNWVPQENLLGNMYELYSIALIS